MKLSQYIISTELIMTVNNIKTNAISCKAKFSEYRNLQLMYD